MPPHPLTNFENQNYYQNKSSINGVLMKISKIQARKIIFSFYK